MAARVGRRSLARASLAHFVPLGARRALAQKRAAPARCEPKGAAGRQLEPAKSGAQFHFASRNEHVRPPGENSNFTTNSSSSSSSSAAQAARMKTQAGARMRRRPTSSKLGRLAPALALAAALALALGLAGADSEPGDAEAARQRGKRTLYACEDQRLNISCQPAESIQLIRANYGRFSISKCNEHAQLDWKVNCMSPSSFQIITNSCQSRQSCQLLASNAIFGDACPGTQKYLEVSYECVLANRTNQGNLDQAHRPPPGPGQRTAQPNVIAQQQQHAAPSENFARAASATATPPNSFKTPFGIWSTPGGLQAQPASPAPPPLAPRPAWIVEQAPGQQQSRLGAQTHLRCPEMVSRHIRWPATEAGLLVRMPCPSHAQPRDLGEPHAASLACLASADGGAAWAPRVEAARCQSSWLRNLTERLELGDSPIAVLSELVHRTAAPAAPAASPLAGFAWMTAPAQQQQQAAPAALGLFGDDLLLVGKIARRLVENSGDLLNRIADEKQRVAFTREIVQSLAELANNLALEQHAQAWLDLSSVAPDRLAPGERQLAAGQLVQALEGGAVLLAGALASSARLESPSERHQPEEAFVKATANAFVCVRSLSLHSEQQQQSEAGFNKSLELSFPSESSTLGTKWMGGEQRFTLHLQASSGVPIGSANGAEQQSQEANLAEAKSPATDELAPGPSLKIVFVMIRALGAQMEPVLANQAALIASAEGALNRGPMLQVDSNLASFSIVADPRYKYAPIKVDLTAPIELAFRHLEPRGAELSSSRRRTTQCVYWDANTSDWLSEGCKLVGSNQTHSICACNHLTTFALLSDDAANVEQLADSISNNRQNHHHHQQPKVQLDSVENEPILANNKLLYLSKLLDGRLFDNDHLASASQSQQQRPRLLLYVSCLLSAALLALHLAASAYNQAHARRLLGAIPAQPPPPLLISNMVSARPAQSAPSLSGPAHSGQTRALNSDSSPTYSSDYSAALAANKSQLEAEARLFNQPANMLPPQLAKRLSSQLRVPAHLIVQMLALELLLVLLVESQNYLQRSRSSHQEAASFFQLQLQPQQETTNFEPLATIGALTWLLVLALYYLIATFTCWLASRLLALDYNLARAAFSWSVNGPGCHLRGSPSTSSSTASDKSQPQYAANPTALYGHPLATNLYGGQNLYGQYGSAQAPAQGGLHSSTSPSSSTYSGLPDGQSGGALYATDQKRVRPALLQSLWLEWPTSSPLGHSGASNRPAQLLKASLVHGTPLICAGLIGWLSSGRSQALNSITFVTSLGQQLASWPLLVDLGAAHLLLYYLPTVCLVLAGFALLFLRYASSRLRRAEPESSGVTARLKQQQQQQRATSSALNPYGAFEATQHAPTNLRAELHEALGKQAEAHLASRRRAPPQHDLKKAKLSAITLLALLALHATTWLAFFAHLHQALTGAHANNYLVYAFAASNALLVALLVWSQRRSLRRALQLSGASRLAGCLRARGALEAAARKQRPNLKVSPSSQSLFLVSQQQQQQQQQQQHYGSSSNYGHFGLQPQQHLYQQVAHTASQQHLCEEQQRALNAAQLMQQQHFTLNRSFGFQRQHQAAAGRQPLTLKAGALAELEREQLLLLANQQQHSLGCQPSGEAEGPLVAIGQQQQHSASATFGPHSAAQQQQQQHQQQTMHHHHQARGQRSGTQLFSVGQRQLEPQLPSGPISAANAHCLAQGPASAEPNQHQYYSINNRLFMDEQQQQQQQRRAQQNEPSAQSAAAAHFRPATANQQQQQQQQRAASGRHEQQQRHLVASLLEQQQALNIYDVANYAA